MIYLWKYCTSEQEVQLLHSEKIMLEKHDFKADSETIKGNIIRLWGTISAAERTTGISRKTLHTIINDGGLTNPVIGQLVKLGVDPGELIKDLETDKKIAQV